jgi:hypothetical protein
LRLSLAFYLVSGSKKGQRTLAIPNRPSGWPYTLLCIFPPPRNVCVSTSASDHTRSLFNDGGGFYDARHITRKKPVKKIFSKFGSIQFVCKTWIIRKQPRFFTKKPGLIRRITAAARSAISASPNLSLGRAIIGRPLRNRKRRRSFCDLENCGCAAYFVRHN